MAEQVQTNTNVHAKSFDDWKDWKKEIGDKNLDTHLQKLTYMFSEQQLNILS